MIGRAVRLAWLALLAAASSHAQSPAAIDAFDSAFRDWMTRHAVTRGTLAVTFLDRLGFERGYGGQDSGERVLLASLSKAITGRCVAALIVNGGLALDSTLGDVLAPFFRRHGEPADARVKAVTVEQLLVHRGGFAPAPRDLMAPAAVALLQNAKSPATATSAELLAATLGAQLDATPGTAFRYSNIGYLALGVMIESVTSEDYERYCSREVLAYAGIKGAALDPSWRAFSSFGGWRLSATEYAAFLARDRIDDLLVAFTKLPDGPAKERAVQRTARLMNLLLDPYRRHAASSAPSAWSPAWYALGQFTAETAPASAGRLAWHAGSWGVAPDTIGLQAAQHQSGAAWVAWFTPRPGKEATDALLQRLAALPPTITEWPRHDLFAARGLDRPAAR
jgi:CubicO group peptidase (beta-lactamase class C family)